MKQICKPSFKSGANDYLTVLPVENIYLLIIAGTVWSVLVLLSIVELMFVQSNYKVTNFDDKVALLVAALIFSGGLFPLYIARFDRDNFCLMNKNDPFCEGANKTNCFIPRQTVFSDFFGFGGFIEIESGKGFEYLSQVAFDKNLRQKP